MHFKYFACDPSRRIFFFAAFACTLYIHKISHILRLRSSTIHTFKCCTRNLCGTFFTIISRPKVPCFWGGHFYFWLRGAVYLRVLTRECDTGGAAKPKGDSRNSPQLRADSSSLPKFRHRPRFCRNITRVNSQFRIRREMNLLAPRPESACGPGSMLSLIC